MRRFLAILIILLMSSPIKAFQPYKAVGAKSISMGGVSLLPADFWSVFNNQAGLATENYWAAGFAYDSYLGIDKNLSLKSGGILIPTNGGTFGLSLNYFGYSAYNEQKIGLAYGKSLGKFISAGLQIDYLSVSIGNDYGQASAITFELGIIAKLSDNWQIASHIYNPFMVKLGKINPEIIPAVFKLATAYKIDDAILLLAEYEQQSNIAGIIKFGIEYQLIEQFFVRAGLSTNPDIFSFGIGLKMNAFNLDFGTSYHQVLGFSPKAAMYYRFK